MYQFFNLIIRISMKKKNVVVFIGVFLFFCSCKNSNSNNNYEFNTQTIRWRTNKDFEIRDIIKDIQYIILEETPESIFADIYKLIIKNNRIYILDIRPKALLVFEINGKFLYKIGRQGGGPGEYSNSLINFAVSENDEVIVYDHGKREMMKYDKNGKYINSIKSSFSFNDFLVLPDNQFLLSLDIYEKSNKNRKVIITDDMKKSKNSYFHYHKDYKNDKLNMVSFQPFEDKIAYMCAVNDTLFIFDNKGALEQALFFDFGNRKLPEELKNNYERVSEERRNGRFSDYIFNAPVCIKNYIIIEMFVNGKKCISVYDRTNNTLTHEILEPDKFSLYNINFPLCTVSDSLLVSYLDADTYFSVKNHFSINTEVDTHLANGGTIIILNTIK